MVLVALEAFSVVVAVEVVFCKHILSEERMQVNTDRSMIDFLTHFLYVSACLFWGSLVCAYSFIKKSKCKRLEVSE